MFSTFESAKVDIPPIFDYQDERWWAYVNVQLFTTYFHMVIEYEGSDGDRVSNTILYHDVGQVISTAEEEGVLVKEIQAVLPFHKSEKPHWTMEPVSEILGGLEPGLDHEQLALIIVLKNGKRIVESALDTPEEELVRLTSWLKIA